MARLLTVNGVTFDRDRFAVRNKSPRRHRRARFEDDRGRPVACIHAHAKAIRYHHPEYTGKGVSLFVARLTIARLCRGFDLDAEGWEVNVLAGRIQDWSPLVDLAVEAGLILPEPACR